MRLNVQSIRIHILKKIFISIISENDFTLQKELIHIVEIMMSSNTVNAEIY